jgi:exodeoxyribonuclease VII large subunit
MTEQSISLSDLLSQVGNTLKKGMPGSYWIVAEIMELHVNRSGHCYLELVEKGSEDGKVLARARATIWSSRYSMLRPYFETSTGTPLRSGIKILCKGSVEFHSQFGFSINLTDIDPSYTLGDLARKKQEVIARLRSEGVMDMNHGLPFPEVPQRIAVISSESAAGYGDFMDSLNGNRQGYAFRTTLFQAVMQGQEAPLSIMDAFDRIHQEVDQYDCVVILRGGGAKADLECFNNYDLAFYVTQFPLPVVTGIGHERDESVVDLVASRKLKTPTAVAEFLVDQLLAFEFRLTEYRDRLSTVLSFSVQQRRLHLERMSTSLVQSSGRFLQQMGEDLQLFHLSLEKNVALDLDRKKSRLEQLGKQIQLVDPANVLKRGYTMTLLNGKAIRDAAEVRPGDLLETRLGKGLLVSKTEKSISNTEKGSGKHGKKIDDL